MVTMHPWSHDLLTEVNGRLAKDCGVSPIQSSTERHTISRHLREELLHGGYSEFACRDIALRLQYLEHDYRIRTKRPDLEEAALQSFVHRQSQLRRTVVNLKRKDLDWLREYISRWLGPAPSIDCVIDRAKHGPGAVSESLYNEDKWLSAVCLPWYKSADPLERLNWLPLESRLPSKVVCVPKDSRGPRIIAEEPAGSMFVQQGVLSHLAPIVARRCPIMRQTSHIRHMVQHRSEISTVDLKDASDNLTWHLASLLLPAPWARLLATCRTPFATVRGRHVRVYSAACMGSALCFPLLTVVCHSLNVLSHVRMGISDSWCSTMGDDLIIHSSAIGYLRFLLEGCGLVLNDDKSSTYDSWLVESCGADVSREYGLNIRPLYLRRVDLETDDEATVALSLLDSATAFQHHGLVRTSAYLREKALEFVPRCLRSDIGKVRWNRRYHRLETRVLDRKSAPYESRLVNGYAFNECYFGIGGERSAREYSHIGGLDMSWSSISNVVAYKDQIHILRA